MSRKIDPVIHFEMPVEDATRARKFYENVFGWQTQDLGPEAGGFILAFTSEVDENRLPKKVGVINGGFYQKSKAGQQIKLTILVDDIREATRKIEAAGGRMVGEVSEMPGVGLFATFRDPDGNEKSINQDFSLRRLPDAR